MSKRSGCPTCRSTRRPATAISASSRRRRTSSKRSSATCSTWRGSKAAAIRSGSSRCRWPICSYAWSDRHLPAMRDRGVVARAGDRAGHAADPRGCGAPRTGAAEPRRQRHPAHARRADASCCTRRPPTTASASWCATPVPASRRSTWRACSIGSTRWMRRGRAPRCRRAAASGCRSSARSSSGTAARSPPRTRPKEARCSSSCCRHTAA